MPKTLAALALMLAFTLPAAPAPADEETATLTVHGEGRVSAAPDMATIRTGVETDGRTAAEALAENSAAATQMIESLKAGGVEDRDIQTGRLSVQPVYADNQRTRTGQRPEVVGYRVMNEVAVTVRDLDTLGRLLDRVVAAGANRIDSIGFDMAESTGQADEARRRAVADARRRAEVLAGAAGVRLARILSINEGGGVVRPMQRDTMMMRAEAMDAPIERGEMEIGANVTVVWEIAGQD